jgi:hypothetical protein
MSDPQAQSTPATTAAVEVRGVDKVFQTRS